MSKFLSICTAILIFLLAQQKFASGQLIPNLKVSLSDDTLTNIVKKLVPQIFAKYSSITIPNQPTTHCLLSKMKATVTEIDQTDIKLTLNPSKQTLNINIKELNLLLNMIFDCRNSFLSVMGGGSAQGHISIDIEFQILKNDKGQPEIKILKTDPQIVRRQFQIILDCQDCPSYVKDILEKLIEQYVLPSGQFILSYFIGVDIKTEINHLVSKKYQLTKEINGQDISISTDLMSKPLVVYDHVEFDLSGRVFKTSSPDEDILINNVRATQIPSKSSLSNNNISIDVNPNAVSQVFQIAKQQNMTYNFNFYNYNVDVNIPSTELSYVDISSGKLRFTGTPEIKLINNATGNIKYTFVSTMNLYFNLVSYQPEDDDQSAELLKLQLDDIRLVTFKYKQHSNQNMHQSFISEIMKFSFKVLQSYGFIKSNEEGEENKEPVIAYNYSLFVVLCNIALSFMRHIWGLLDLSVFNHMWSVPIFELDGFTIMKLNSKFKNDHAEIGVQAEFIGTFQ